MFYYPVLPSPTSTSKRGERRGWEARVGGRTGEAWTAHGGKRVGLSGWTGWTCDTNGFAVMAYAVFTKLDAVGRDGRDRRFNMAMLTGVEIGVKIGYSSF